MNQLQVITGSGTTAWEASNNARELFNAEEGDKRIVQVETIARSVMMVESLIWYTVHEEEYIQPQPVKRYIGSPAGADPLNP